MHTFHLVIGLVIIAVNPHRERHLRQIGGGEFPSHLKFHHHPYPRRVYWYHAYVPPGHWPRHHRGQSPQRATPATDRRRRISFPSEIPSPSVSATSILVPCIRSTWSLASSSSRSIPTESDTCDRSEAENFLPI